MFLYSLSLIFVENNGAIHGNFLRVVNREIGYLANVSCMSIYAIVLHFMSHKSITLGFNGAFKAG